MQKNDLNLSNLSIAMHSSQARYYHFRTPYIPNLFKKISENLHLDKSSVVADLGCGRGEVANYLSNFAGKVYGIDGSKEMIGLANQKPNIQYLIHDLNNGPPHLPSMVDHVFFGRSIHWFSNTSLKSISNKIIKKDGKFIVCSSQWKPIGPWGKEYADIKKNFQTQLNILKADFTGKDNLESVGYHPQETFSLKMNCRTDVNFLIGHTLATSYLSNLSQLEKNLDNFKDIMHIHLGKYEARNEIALEITSWAIIYRLA